MKGELASESSKFLILWVGLLTRIAVFNLNYQLSNKTTCRFLIQHIPCGSGCQHQKNTTNNIIQGIGRSFFQRFFFARSCRRTGSCSATCLRADFYRSTFTIETAFLCTNLQLIVMAFFYLEGALKNIPGVIQFDFLYITCIDICSKQYRLHILIQITERYLSTIAEQVRGNINFITFFIGC
ncbi:hypothetical protein D3C71_1452010 [compost metagenome]